MDNTDAPLQTQPTDGHPDRLPLVDQMAVVQCPGFRCLAYRDANGIWRDAHNDPLPEVLAFTPLP